MSIQTGAFPVHLGGVRVGTVTVSQSNQRTSFACVCNNTTRDVLRLAAVCSGRFVPLGVVMPDGDTVRLNKNYTRAALGALGFDTAESYHLIRAGDVWHGDAIAPDAAPEPVPITPEPKPIKPEPAPVKPEPVIMQAPPAETSSLNLDAPAPAPDTSEAAAPLDGWMPLGAPSGLFDDPELTNAVAGLDGALTAQRDGARLLAVPVSPAQPFAMMPVFCFGASEAIGGTDYIVFKIKNGRLVMM